MVQDPLWWGFIILLPPLYWLCPLAWRTWLLALTSTALLSVYAGPDLLVMLGLGALVYVGFHRDPKTTPGWALRAARSSWPFWSVMAYFIWAKYLPSIARLMGGQGSFADFAVPLGISYFSFKLLHYVIEMRRGNLAEHRFDDFASWLFLAPIFTAGPIERFDHYLHERRIAAFEPRFITEGALRIIIGLVKKFYLGALVLVAIKMVAGDGLIGMVRHLEDFGPLTIWAVLLLTLLAVYLDFSAYSDIAIGTSRLFGLRIMENFNFPFLATSLQQFWQRWHMTLAHWCRSYIYMGMIGLTRNPYWAVIATFVTMGVWHSAGPHWIAWGVWHGFGMAGLLHWSRFAARRKIRFFKTRTGKITGWAMTMAYVSLGGALTALHGHASLFQSFRIILAAFGIRI